MTTRGHSRCDGHPNITRKALYSTGIDIDRIAVTVNHNNVACYVKPAPTVLSTTGETSSQVICDDGSSAPSMNTLTHSFGQPLAAKHHSGLLVGSANLQWLDALQPGAPDDGFWPPDNSDCSPAFSSFYHFSFSEHQKPSPS